MSMFLPPPSTVLPFDTAAGTGSIVGGRGLVRGVAIEETGGAVAARVVFLDGGNAAAPMLFPIRLAIGDSKIIPFGSEGWVFQRGLFVTATAGAADGTVAVMLEEEMSVDMHRIIFGQTESGYFSQVSDSL